ncbi:MAG: hypothetical protein LAT56_00330 [Wenzhouxiangella sp.]|nr:hypothetical protein [Wenzhouxiangella sp.]
MSDTATMEPQTTTGGDSGAEQAVESQQTDTSLTGGQQEQQSAELPKWMYQLPGELQKHEHLSKYSTIGELAKSFVDREAKADRLVEIPAEDADEETRQAFLNRLGRPESAEGYELEAPEDRDTVGFTEADENAYREKAHELGLTQEQAKALHDWQMSRTREALEQGSAAQQEMLKEQTEALKKEWGGKFNENITKAKKAFAQFGGDELAAYLKDTKQDAAPPLIKAFVELYNRTAEDSLVSGSKDRYGNPAEFDWYPTMEE